MGDPIKATHEPQFPELTAAAPTRHSTGILPYQIYRDFVARGRIAADPPITDAQLQPASIDLRLGRSAWRVRASFLPGPGATVESKLAQVRMHELDLAAGAVLEKDCVYIIKLVEQLKLPADIGGTANPKSSTGRLDIFTRLITDYAGAFEDVRKGYKGPLYVEVSPRTFSVLASAGTSLNQLRLRRGDPPSWDKTLRALHSQQGIAYSADDKPEAKIDQGLRISIDLAGGDGSPLIGYRARAHTPLIDLAKVDHYDPLEFWEPIHRAASRTIVLNPSDFYILASKEKIRVPTGYAAEMVPFDPSVGEFRIHYA
ncbi:MAG: 2'-deoxycytidine 5'-triphosphate deaminase, partial [Proteobacteria bacterium]|nr:2'-deoxycytidine 5'-triphosphate deaminase [Pseudomonadota bacterium]